MPKLRDLFISTINEINATKAAFRRALRHGDLQEPTRHPGSKKKAHLVKAERRRQGKAAKQARKLNRTGKARPKGYR